MGQSAAPALVWPSVSHPIPLSGARDLLHPWLWAHTSVKMQSKLCSYIVRTWGLRDRSSALLKSVLEALSGKTLASGPRQGGPGLRGDRNCPSFVELEQSGLGVKGAPSGAERCVAEG